LRTCRSRIDEHGVGGEHNSSLVEFVCCSFGVPERAAQTAANRPFEIILIIFL
jgi:hypothetical protein